MSAALSRRRRFARVRARLITGIVAAVAVSAIAGVSPAAARHRRVPLRHVRHLVVIYLGNRSFDNLYGDFAGGDGLAAADPQHTIQTDLAGAPLKCLPQTDPHLTSPPLPADACSRAAGDAFDSH